jgi:hypothetical protein
MVARRPHSPSIRCGRPGCVLPPRELDIRPPERPVIGPPPPSTPLSTAPDMAAVMASRRSRASEQTTAAAAWLQSRITATTANAPASALIPPDPGTEPGQASGPDPGTRAQLCYFTAQASTPRAKGTHDLGFNFPEQTHSKRWYDVRSTSKQRPATMPVERSNVVSERVETVDERGKEGVGMTPAAL